MSNNNFKYTTDGRKVVIIGDLNQSEKIVQEIFVTDDGSEIPAGEKFTVKSLLDQPAKSWKEQKLKEIEERYNSLLLDYETKNKDLNRYIQQIKERKSAIKNGLEPIIIELQNGELNPIISSIIQFYSFDFEYVISHNEYSILKVMDFNEFLSSSTYEGQLKMMILCGNKKKETGIILSTYPDGSGNKTNITLCKDESDLKLNLQALLNNKTYIYDSDIELVRQYNLKLDKEKLSGYFAKKRKESEHNLKANESANESIKDKLEELKKLEKELS